MNLVKCELKENKDDNLSAKENAYQNFIIWQQESENNNKKLEDTMAYKMGYKHDLTNLTDFFNMFTTLEIV